MEYLGKEYSSVSRLADMFLDLVVVASVNVANHLIQKPAMRDLQE